MATGLRSDRREVLLTTMLDAEPDARHKHPEPTVAPVLLAVATGVTFIVGMFTPWGFTIGAVLGFFALLVWAFPGDKEKEEEEREEIVEAPAV